MTPETLDQRIRAALGEVFHRKQRLDTGDVDIEAIASEHGVSEEQILEQMAWLREQSLIGGPLEEEGRQISGLPYSGYDEHHLTNRGVAWAEAGFPEVLADED
jgi:hypothetical protein